jgi:protoporphyrinogen oxidase
MSRDARTRPSTVLVMGAGPGGLAAGHKLAENGVRSIVVEAAPFVGGLSRTIQRDGFRFDLGGHRWFTKNEDLNDWFRALMKDELILVPRISRIYFNGKFFLYPISIKNVLANAGIPQCIAAVFSYGAAQLRYGVFKKPVTTMQEAFEMQFGHVLYEMFFRRYSEKVWGRPCSEMSADWVSQRTKGVSIVSALREALLKPKEKLVSLVDEFMYPRWGYMRISERMAEDIVSWGGAVHLQQRVVKISHTNGHVKSVTTRDVAGRESVHAADAFVSSIPLTLLVQIMDPPAPQAVVDSARSLKFRDIITVNLMLERPQVTNDTWLYIHDETIPFGRLHEPKNWSPDMVPDTGKTSLVLEFFCTEGDAIWSRSDEELCQVAIDVLADRLRFFDKREVIGGFAVRAKQAYPIYTLGYSEPLAALKDYVRSFTNLEIIGRGGTFRYNNADHSIETGLLSALNLLGGQHDIDLVNADAEYHEEKRVRTGG